MSPGTSSHSALSQRLLEQRHGSDTVIDLPSGTSLPSTGEEMARQQQILCTDIQGVQKHSCLALQVALMSHQPSVTPLTSAVGLSQDRTAHRQMITRVCFCSDKLCRICIHMHDVRHEGCHVVDGTKPKYMPRACRHLTAAGVAMVTPGQEEKHGQRSGGGQGGDHGVANT